MWEWVSFMLAMVVIMFIVHYIGDPKQLIEDIKSLKGSSQKIEELERRIAALEQANKDINSPLI